MGSSALLVVESADYSDDGFDAKYLLRATSRLGV